MGEIYKLVTSLEGDDESLKIAMEIDTKIEKMQHDIDLLSLNSNYRKEPDPLE